MGGTAITPTISGNAITISIASVTDNVIIKVPTVNISTGEETTYYTITYNYVNSDGTVIQTATTESVAAGTIKTFSTSNAPSISGYTISSVSPTSATINANTTVTYYYNAVSGDSTGTIIWSNHKYQSGVGLASATNRACARITALHGKKITIPGLTNFVPVDLVAFDADGAATGYTSATSTEVRATNTEGNMVFYVPTSGAFTDAATVGLVIKLSSEATINIDTLPTTYYQESPLFTNARFDSKTTFDFISDNTRLATTYIAVGANKTVTITNIPTGYSDLVPVDCVEYNSDKEYIKFSSNATSTMNDTTMTITLPSSLSATTAYVRISMKRSTSSGNIYATNMLDCTITSS